MLETSILTLSNKKSYSFPWFDDCDSENMREINTRKESRLDRIISC